MDAMKAYASWLRVGARVEAFGAGAEYPSAVPPNLDRNAISEPPKHVTDSQAN